MAPFLVTISKCNTSEFKVTVSFSFYIFLYQIVLLYCKFHLFCTYEDEEYKKGNKVIFGRFTSAKVAVAFSHWLNAFFGIGTMLFHIDLTNVRIGLTFVQLLQTLTFFI